MNNTKFICPVCGYDKLDCIPYSKINSCKNIYLLIPPYEVLGKPSYDVCSCCGYEFGNDDNPGQGCIPISFDDYFQDWVNTGMIWFDKSLEHNNWNISSQIENKKEFIKNV